MEDNNSKTNENNLTPSKSSGKTTHSHTNIIIFSVAFLISAVLIANAIASLQRNSTGSVSVKGYAEMEIKSDIAIWNGSVSTKAATLEEGYATIKLYRTRIEKYLTDNGFVKDDNFEFQTMSANENIDYLPSGEQRKRGYYLYQNFQVISKDVYKIKNLSSQIMEELIPEGIGISSFEPQYSYSKLNEIKVNMLSEATKDAKKRAEKIAASNGNKIGNIISANQGVFQITAPFSNEINDYGINDVSSINKTIKSVVTVEYLIKR